jgi:D-alanyl-D-alanine carboxypeptidase/D-alanyl-D-alanine-endopeptidase (penicillin-binding protein 4)
MWQDPDLRSSLLSALPIAGETGTLEHRMRKAPAHGLVRAKTGTTDNASSLSGFVGDRYVFSILENGSPVRTVSAEASQNRFGQVLARAATSQVPSGGREGGPPAAPRASSAGRNEHAPSLGRSRS